MFICNRCNKTHDGRYGSGKFCNQLCAMSRKGVPRKPLYHNLSEEEAAIKRAKRVKICRDAALVKAAKNKEISKIKVESGEWSDLTVSQRKTRILIEQNYSCALCKIGMTWNDLPLQFDVDHIDGDRNNNTRENLRCVCPNCHSQTPTYKSKNATSKRYSDEEIIYALKHSDSVYKALSSLGMNLHGGNYVRVRKIIKKYELKLDYLTL